MKRDCLNQENNYSSCSSSNKGKMRCSDVDRRQNDAGVDELLTVVGYNVKSADMASVAQKIERLEEVMGTSQQDGYLSNLASETIHYNPSDISSWLESMISGLNPLSEFDSSSSNIPQDPFLGSTQTGLESNFGSDLVSIPAKAVYPGTQLPPSPPSRKRPKTTSFNEPTQQVVLMDSQEKGVRLVHTLMACAEAVQQGNVKLAEGLVQNIGVLAVSQAGAMRKVATYFAEALARRIYKLYPPNLHDSVFIDVLEMHFYEACPYLKFAHFTANQAVLEAFAGKKRVHVIDFGVKQGMQWPALLQALALRAGGPPMFRLTGIGLPSNDGVDHLEEAGWKLAQLAKTINVEFEYRSVVASSLDDLNAGVFDIREGETVAVNSIFELHPLLGRPGAIEKVFGVVREIRPEILTVVEQEAYHNGAGFLVRFNESLHYYSTLFDSLESNDGVANDQDKVMSEVYLGRQICNVVACEGVDRVERHETLDKWRNRLGEAGFKPAHLGSNAYKQASMLLALFGGGDGYRVEENSGCLMLGWHTRPLIATSAWKLS